MDLWVQILLTIIAGITGIVTSAGFWAFLQRKYTVRSQTDRLLLGLAYDKIITMGMAYIERGWITKDEYEDYRKYLYEPYKALGGNGVTERVVAEVSNLPLRSRAKYAEILREAKTRSQEQRDPSDFDIADAYSHVE